MDGASPYRAPLRSRTPAQAKRTADRELFPVFALLWAMSVAVVIRCALHHDAFGAEATVALGLVIALPLLVVRGTP